MRVACEVFTVQLGLAVTHQDQSTNAQGLFSQICHTIKGEDYVSLGFCMIADPLICLLGSAHNGIVISHPDFLSFRQSNSVARNLKQI